MSDTTFTRSAEPQAADRTAIPLKHSVLHGHEVGYRLAGAGDETILLIHGMAGSSRTWRDVMPTLAQRYQVIAPDLLGHGESAKPMGDYSLGAHASGLRDLLTRLGITRATVVGHSLGGGVALQLAYQHPELCERLVLVDSGGLGRGVSWLLRACSLPGSELVLPLVAPRYVRDHGNSVNRWLGDHNIRHSRFAEMWRHYSSLAEPENRRAFVRTLRSVVDYSGQTVSANDRLYLAAAVPTLIMWGTRDTIIPVEHAYAAQDAIPHSRLEIFPGTGTSRSRKTPSASSRCSATSSTPPSRRGRARAGSVSCSPRARRSPVAFVGRVRTASLSRLRSRSRHASVRGPASARRTPSDAIRGQACLP